MIEVTRPLRGGSQPPSHPSHHSHASNLDEENIIIVSPPLEEIHSSERTRVRTDPAVHAEQRRLENQVKQILDIDDEGETDEFLSQYNSTQIENYGLASTKNIFKQESPP